VAKAHQLEAGLLVLGHVHVLLIVATILPDPLQHLDDLLVGTAMERAPERHDTGGDRGEEVGLARPHHAHRRGAAVLLVIGVQDEQQVERLVEHRRHHIGLGRDGEHHVQEVLGVGEIVPRVDEGLADRLLVGEGGDGAGLGDQADDVELAILIRRRPRVEGRQRRDHRGEHHHRMGRDREVVEELLHRLVDHAVVGQLLVEDVELRLGRQVAVNQQKADLP
jgi:hypothetical protein